MSRTVAIIGAGIAGLSAACYARMNGYEATVFEMGAGPGGLCTSWRRGDYTLDGCIHWLIGTRPDSPAHTMWRELGALADRTIVDHDEFVHLIGPDGRTLVMYTDADRLEEHLRSLSPQDAEPIAELARAIRELGDLAVPIGQAPELAPDRWMDRTASPRSLATLPWLRLRGLDVARYASAFRDPLLRRGLAAIFESTGHSALSLLLTLAWMHRRDAGYPVGGSLALAQAIERRLLGLGGRISYGARVVRVLERQGRAVGLRLADGTEHAADHVISAADGRWTLFGLLEGRFVDPTVRRRYEHLPVFEPVVMVMLGLDRDLSRDPHYRVWLPDPPVTVAGRARTRLSLRHFGYDPTLAPPGHTILQWKFESDHAYWTSQATDGAGYRDAKARVAEESLALLERLVPGAAGAVRVVDVATPLTFERRTGNWQGSYGGWLPTPRTVDLAMHRRLPGLDRFWLAGHWVTPGGGLYLAAASGRDAVRLVCRQDGVGFGTDVG